MRGAKCEPTTSQLHITYFRMNYLELCSKLNVIYAKRAHVYETAGSKMTLRMRIV
jgi:hypothetical protein